MGRPTHIVSSSNSDTTWHPFLWANSSRHRRSLKGRNWITLITCGGRFRALNPDGSGPGEYLDRDVVIAERVDG